MSDRTAAEVKQFTDWLEHDSDHQQMRIDMQERHKLTNMLKVPVLQEHQTRGMAVSEPTPMLLFLARNLSASILPYPTTITVSPMGDLTIPGQEKADKIEKADSLWWARIDEGYRVTQDTIDNQLLSSYAVWLLRCGAPDEEFPWEIETPDPTTCFFPIERAPFRPSLFARHYKQLVTDVIKTYSGRKNYAGGTWDNKMGQLSYLGGRIAIGSDLPHDQGAVLDSKDPFEMIDVRELHEGDMCYVIAEGKKDREDVLVWTGKSMTGGTSAIIIPGHYSSVGPLAERLQPKLWPAMQMVTRINKLNAELATRRAQMKPDMIIERTPEAAQARAAFGVLPTDEAEDAMLRGGPRKIEVDGHATQWPLLPDPDLILALQEAWKEFNRYIEAESEVTDPEVLKGTNTNPYFANIEARRKQQAPMLTSRAWAIKTALEMYHESLKEYGKAYKYDLYATEDMAGDDNGKKALAKGSALTISAADFPDDFKYRILVEIKSTTESEQRLRVQDAAYNEGIGIATKRDVIDASGAPDLGKKLEELTVDSGHKMMTPLITHMALLITNEKVFYRGMDVSAILGVPPVQGGPPQAAPQQLPQQEQPQPPPGAPGTGGGMPPFRPAVVPGAPGQSGQAVA